MSTATTIPEKWIAGDTVTWTHTDSERTPAGGWTLSYGFARHGAKFTAAGVASADNLSWTVSAPSELSSGQWHYAARVTDGADNYSTATGDITVTPDIFASDQGVDLRSANERWRDALLEARQHWSNTPRQVLVDSDGGQSRQRTFRTLQELDDAIRLAEGDVRRDLMRAGKMTSQTVVRL